jgi:hypothetical protein
MRWVGHLVYKGENINVYRILVGKIERDCLETQGTDGRIILKRTLKKWDGTVQTGFICLGTGTFGRLVNTV